MPEAESEKCNRPPCKYFMKGTCTKSSCEYWHPPNVRSIKRNRDVRSALSAHSCTGRFTNNQAKSRKRVKTKVQLLTWKVYEERMTGKPVARDSRVAYHDKGAVAVVKAQFGVVSRKTQSHRNFRKAWGIWETRGIKFWDQFDEYDSHSLRYVMQVSEKKDHRLDKYKSKFLISEVPTP